MKVKQSFVKYVIKKPSSICIIWFMSMLILSSCSDSTSHSTRDPNGLKVINVEIINSTGARLDVSPDNSMIAFDKAGEDGLTDLYIMDIDGSNVVCLSSDKPELNDPVRFVGNPEWHPNGEWILFQVEQSSHFGDIGDNACRPGSGYFNELWMIKPDGTGLTRILELNITTDPEGTLHPHFNSAGDKLVWSHIVAGPEVGNPNLKYGDYRVRSASFSFNFGIPELGEYQQFMLGVPAFYETHGFSSDGSRILLSGNPDSGQSVIGIDIMEVSASTGAIVTRYTNTLEEWDEHAHYSPSSERILFASTRGYTVDWDDFNNTIKADLWVINKDGTQNKLTFFNEENWDIKPSEITGNFFTGDGDFSSDGRSYYVYLIPGGDDLSGYIVRLDFNEPF